MAAVATFDKNRANFRFTDCVTVGISGLTRSANQHQQATDDIYGRSVVFLSWIRCPSDSRVSLYTSARKTPKSVGILKLRSVALERIGPR